MPTSGAAASTRGAATIPTPRRSGCSPRWPTAFADASGGRDGAPVAARAGMAVAVRPVGVAGLAPLRERQVAPDEFHLVLRAQWDAGGDWPVDIGARRRRREQPVRARHATHGAGRV